MSHCNSPDFFLFLVTSGQSLKDGLVDSGGCSSWFILVETLGDPQSSLLLKAGFNSDRLAWEFVRSQKLSRKGGDFSASLGPFHCSVMPSSEDFLFVLFPSIRWEFLLFRFLSAVPCPTQPIHEEMAPSPWEPCGYQGAASVPPLNCPFSRLSEPIPSSLSWTLSFTCPSWCPSADLAQVFPVYYWGSRTVPLNFVTPCHLSCDSESNNAGPC